MNTAMLVIGMEKNMLLNEKNDYLRISMFLIANKLFLRILDIEDGAIRRKDRQSKY